VRLEHSWSGPVRGVSGICTLRGASVRPNRRTPCRTSGTVSRRGAVSHRACAGATASSRYSFAARAEGQGAWQRGHSFGLSGRPGPATTGARRIARFTCPRRLASSPGVSDFRCSMVIGRLHRGQFTQPSRRYGAHKPGYTTRRL
jgi:hypothetical protein